METEWTLAAERQRLCDGVHDGYLKHAINKLLPKLPAPKPEWEDLWQTFFIVGLEAIDGYEVDRGTKFTTFLYGHLQMRSMQFFNTAWQRQNTPADRWIVNLSALTHQFGNSDEGGEVDVDPTAVRDDQEITAQLVEFRQHLAPRSIQLLDYLLEFQEWDKINGTEYLDDALHSDLQDLKLSTLTGLDRAEVKEFLWDLEVAKTKCISGMYYRRVYK